MIFTGFDYSVTIDKSGKVCQNGEIFDGIQIDGELRVKKIVFSERCADILPFCDTMIVYYIDQNNRLWSIQYPCRCYPRKLRGCNSEVKKLQLIPDEEVIELVSYGAKIACVTADKELYVWGHFENMICSTISTDNPTYVETVKSVTQVALGYEHMLILDTEGNVHVAGKNDHGQTGLGKSTEEVRELTKLRIGTDRTKIIQVACGCHSSAVLTLNGQVYVFGRLEPLDKQFRPLQVQLTDVVEISLSYEHILARTKESKVYAWGWNSDKQCGFGSREWAIKKPRLIKDLSGYNVTKISAGNSHSLVKFIEYETIYRSNTKL